MSELPAPAKTKRKRSKKTIEKNDRKKRS